MLKITCAIILLSAVRGVGPAQALMRYLNYFEWDQGQRVWFIPHTPQGENHPATWMTEMSPASGWQRTQSRHSQRKWFPLSVEILESMADPCKTAALFSLGESLEVPSLEEEWRGSTGALHPHWHPGHLSVRAHVSLAGDTRGCSCAEPQPAGGVQLCCSCLPSLALCHCTNSQGKTHGFV